MQSAWQPRAAGCIDPRSTAFYYDIIQCTVGRVFPFLESFLMIWIMIALCYRSASALCIEATYRRHTIIALRRSIGCVLLQKNSWHTNCVSRVIDIETQIYLLLIFLHILVQYRESRLQKDLALELNPKQQQLYLRNEHSCRATSLKNYNFMKIFKCVSLGQQKQNCLLFGQILVQFKANVADSRIWWDKCQWPAKLLKWGTLRAAPRNSIISVCRVGNSHSSYQEMKIV